ncbi:HAD-IA family hydrolase [Candidatus Saccharibacteria bacterium]|nr:HAD-IA family hydrolase [Candidatus Saccharibacteria bacterium]
MIRAIIFDCFGVLVKDHASVVKEKYFSDNLDDRAEFQELNRRSCKGELSWSELLTEVAELASVSVSEIRETFDNNPRNNELLDFIAHDLKPKYKIGFLSNASTDHVHELFTPEQIKLFDDVVLSYQVHMIKPNPKIYKLAAERLNVEITECLLVDNSARYVEGAENVGMRGIVYRSFDQFRNDLEKCNA